MLTALGPYPPQPALALSRPPAPLQLQPAPVEHIDRRGLDQIQDTEPLPAITWLPSHTNVIMIGGEPKQPPWTLRDIAPRHHLSSKFADMWPPAAQYDYIQTTGYLPYDIHGNSVLVRFVGDRGRAIHIFRDDPRWQNPVINNTRTDDPWAHRFGPVEDPVPDDMPRQPIGMLTGPDAGATAPANTGPIAAEGVPLNRDAGAVGAGFTAANK